MGKPSFFMALIQCNECGKQISDTAKACPHCGAPCEFNEESRSSDMQFPLFIVIMFATFLIAIIAASN